ncbi:PigN-domain-containing protein [Terfezia boudieri ATCC MYA-4762]|uniref:GPI ethanolamine phosphate transferase 1 n=1 Tax=Terfezia boudieri ATCC MYA-4762 TaxID=1051890 RepID=A0A3N4M6Y5_9PEZI|nr:PigN-domain-containing protein [Terfezia boudieri ATCC MYA-4762]
MAQLGRLGFLGIAVIFHLIYIYSIFDIYFVSPIVHGMRPYGVNTPAPAKRLFLIVGDGLRADKCFQSHPDPFSALEKPPVIHLAPFIRKKVLEEGTFGVSHTRVPTESRPGHVALIAGLYEDVSAVTTGWKHNPVNFDSLFNESRHTWSWGSPDILPMFKEGASDRSKVDAHTYGHEAEDFTQDATELDTWVFDRVASFFKDARQNATLAAILGQDKLVFFLHLLGLDTTGHSYRPYSKEYLRNIKVVDDGISRISQIVNDFYYHDGKTSWIFTADHGMSDWGSHGDGHPDNTRTPLVAWGAGIRKPVKAEKGTKMSGHDDGFASDWDLEHVRRVDVAQADVAALMSYLVGTDFPVNSVGELPLEYIDANDEVKAKAIFTNARQILEQYKVKEDKKKATELRFKPYPPLGEGLTSLESRTAVIQALIDQGSYQAAIEKSLELIRIGLEGLKYLQTYDWLFLRTLVTAGYLGWIAFALTTVISHHVVTNEAVKAKYFPTVLFSSAVAVALASIIFLQQSSWRYYLYAFFPVYFWQEVFVRKDALITGGKILLAQAHINTPAAYANLSIKAIGYLATLEAIVSGYFYREVFTACFILAAFWPLFYGTAFIHRHKGTIALWFVSCGIMSIFTLLPVVKIEDERLILLGGILMVALGILYMIFGNSIVDPSSKSITADEQNWVSKAILGIQVGLIALSMVVTQSSVRSLQAKQGLPLGNQVVGWGLLILSLTVPFLHGLLRPHTHYVHLLVVVFLAFSPIFVILTISYEGLFYVIFCITLVTWVRIETLQAEMQVFRPLNLADTRVALFFFFLIQIAFFGTGNIASISSFSLDSVYRLIPIFSPFAMGALLMFKILIPFVIISVNLGILNKRLGPLAPSSLFMLVIACSDILTLNFFWLVRDEGSWLDIGTSISHYCIGAGLVVFVSALEVVSEVFVGGVRVEEEEGEVALLGRDVKSESVKDRKLAVRR